MGQTQSNIDLGTLDDHALLGSLQRILVIERRATTAVVMHLAEVDRRGLYRDAGYSSMFSYCTGALHLSEAESYGRIHTARLTRRFPVLLEHLRAGTLNPTTVQVLGPKLTEDNCQELVRQAAGCTRRQVEELLAARFAKPDVPEVVRKLPERRSAPTTSLPMWSSDTSRPAARAQAPAPPVPPAPPRATAVVETLSTERFKVQVTFSRAQRDKLQTARDLLRHRQPDGDLAMILEQGLDLLIERELKRRFGVTDRPRKGRRSAKNSRSRHIPHEARREVLARDGMCCSFVSADGKRCEERAYLELDHVEPFARGGASSADNLRLLCRSHNQLEAERHFGPLFIQQRREAPPEQRCRS